MSSFIDKKIQTKLVKENKQVGSKSLTLKKKLPDSYGNHERSVTEK